MEKQNEQANKQKPVQPWQPKASLDPRKNSIPMIGWYISIHMKLEGWK